MNENTAKPNGLTTVINTIVSPKEAFETIRNAPTWGWAFIIAAVLYVIAAWLMLPASHHVGEAMVTHMTQSGRLAAALSDAQKQQMIQQAAHPGAIKDLTNIIFGIVMIFIAAVLNTLLMLLAKVIGKGDGTFKTLWCGSMNVLVPSFAIGQIVLAIIVVLRGPDAFNSLVELYRALPGLGTLTPSLTGFAGGFFAAISVFAIWGLILNANMVRVVGKASAGVAWTFAIIITILQSLALGAMALL
jgi:hypothetical protein